MRPRPLTVTEMPETLLYIVSPNYLRVMGIPLLRGRFFTSGDSAQSRRVGTIDENFAREYFPNQDPIGQRIRFIRNRQRLQKHVGQQIVRPVMELQALDGDILWRRIEKGAENLLTDPDKTVTCWCAEPSGSSFPLFSQKATWGSTLQVHAAKRFVVVSTDSQASSQQQGLFIWFRREPFASESCSCAYRAKRDRLPTEPGSVPNGALQAWSRGLMTEESFFVSSPRESTLDERKVATL
jgi:MacB-like periplasmic core domain